MIRINLYKKDTIDMNLLIGSYEHEKFNMPFYNTNITLWKGVDNTIEFSIRNHDRKAETIPENCKLVFTAINNKLQQIIKKDLNVVNAKLGRYSVTITKDELNDYDNAIFVGHVSVVDENENEDLLYSGVDWLPNFDVEIKPNNLELTEESEYIPGDSFNREIYQDPMTGKQMERFTSSMIKSDVTEFHTFASKLKDFVGIVKFQGSCCEAPNQSNANWFDIDKTEYVLGKNDSEYTVYPVADRDTEKDLEIDMDISKYCKCEECHDDETIIIDEPFSGNITKAYKLNCLWVRVQYIRELDTPATIEEVYYRN